MNCVCWEREEGGSVFHDVPAPLPGTWSGDAGLRWSPRDSCHVLRLKAGVVCRSSLAAWLPSVGWNARPQPPVLHWGCNTAFLGRTWASPKESYLFIPLHVCCLGNRSFPWCVFCHPPNCESRVFLVPCRLGLPSCRRCRPARQSARSCCLATLSGHTAASVSALLCLIRFPAISSVAIGERNV